MLIWATHPCLVPSTHSLISISQADFYISKLTSIWKELCANLINAVFSYNLQADKKYQPTPNCSIGSKVYLDIKNLKVRWAGRELGLRHVGPLTVLERINLMSYRISTPQ